MKYTPHDADELKEAMDEGVEQWMLDLLKLNHTYLGWGNGEDYMTTSGEGWSSSKTVGTVAELWTQDDLNEVVHGYYFTHRDSVNCTDCEGSGYNPETRKIADDWYGNRNPRDRWDTKLTEDEVYALVCDGRLSSFTHFNGHFNREKGVWEMYNRELQAPITCPAPVFDLAAMTAKVNSTKGGMVHDAINRMICVRVRATRLGVYGHCPNCNGKGSVFTEPTTRMGLQLWFILPRKGCSRGLVVENVTQADIPAIQEFFRLAVERTLLRMGKLAGL